MSLLLSLINETHFPQKITKMGRLGDLTALHQSLMVIVKETDKGCCIQAYWKAEWKAGVVEKGTQAPVITIVLKLQKVAHSTVWEDKLRLECGWNQLGAAIKQTCRT
ncbi:hypothetical protein CRENBAI_018481 [Crenichthys baileyi]|uniref:Uncharacterized protein n=1 Tax=Crenichthys baileyi TaxID=28760 RepID=A0AAV9S3X9_9TELE